MLRRPLRLLLEILASLVGIVIVLSLFLFWRLSAGPMQSAFLTPYIESGIEDLVPGTRVQIDHSLLAWDNDSRAVALHAEGLRIIDTNDSVIAELPVLDVQLSLIGALLGRFFPTELTIDHPQITLERRAGGSFYFGGMAAESSGGGEDNIRDSLARAARDLTHAVFTHTLKITRAVIDVHDTVTKTDWAVHIPEIALERHGFTLTGQAKIAVTQKDQISVVDISYAYERLKGLHRLATHFRDITPAFFAGGHPATLGLSPAAMLDLPLSGSIEIAFDGDLNVASGDVQIHGDKGALNNAALWDQPRPVKSIDIKANYSSGRLDIPAASVDFDGPRLLMSATGEPDKEKRGIMDIGLSVQIDNWPMDQYGQLWPKPIIANARDWIAANLSKGKFEHGEAAFNGTLNLSSPDDIDFTEGKGTVKASGAEVRYVEGMPHVEGVNAEGAFDLNHMTVAISGGGIGDLHLVPFTVTITGFEDKVQNIDIPLKVAGPIPAVMRLIDNPPLGYAKAIGLTPDDIAGKAEAEVTFRFPLLKSLEMKDIAIKAGATLTDVASSKLVHGIDISQGSLALDLTSDGFAVNGPALLNKIPFQIAWKQNFAEKEGRPLREASLTGSITDAELEAAGLDMFEGTRGSMAVSLQMVQPDKEKSRLSGTLDMTEADVHIDQLNWKKPARAPALVKFAADMPAHKDIEITSIEAHGPQMNIKGKATLAAGSGRLLSLNLKPMIVGRTNAALNFSRIEGDKGALHFDAEGEGFDVSGLKGGKDPESSSPEPKEYRINVGKLYTSEDGFIAHAEGYAIRDAKGWSEISLHGLADGGHQLDVDLTMRNDGGRSFSITCDDFGKALKGLGFTDTVRDGKLDIHGESDPENPRAIVGEVKVSSFVVGHLPVLAVLMNAASPFGFAGLFTGSMDFDRLKGKFRWEGDEIKFTGLHAAGAAVGINADGRVNMDTADAHLRGTMVPFSMVNGIIGSIPLLGDILTGGDNQGFLAVSYTINGPLDDPDISVNPASLLTPGFLRNLFFGGDDSSDTSDSQPQDASP